MSMARRRNEVRKKESPKRKAQAKRKVGHDELIAQLTNEDRNPANERSVTEALLEERRSGPADLDEVLNQYEAEWGRFHRVLAIQEGDRLPSFEEGRPRSVIEPLNNPLIEA